MLRVSQEKNTSSVGLNRVGKFSLFSKKIHLLFITVFLLSSLGVAQTTNITNGTTPAGIAPGSPTGSINLSATDTINPYNGNLNFSLPLLAVGGRGRAGYSITLPVSRRWTVNHQYFPELEDYRHFPYPNWWRIPEHRYNAGTMTGRTSGTMFSTGNGSGYGCFGKSLTRLTFTSPDGTEYEFLDQLHEGAPKNNACQSLSRGNTFVTKDGSSATFISDTIIYDQPLNGGITFTVSGYILWSDGTRYRIENSQVSWIRDRNGNTTVFTYDHPSQVGKLIKVTDSLGREINITYDVQNAQHGLHDQIAYKGSNGTPRTIRVSYSSLSAALRSDQTIKTYGQLFVALDDQPGSFNPQVVSSVWLPDDRRYRIYYNSYGEIARTELPLGGAFEYDWGASLLNGQSDGVVQILNNLEEQGARYFPEINRRVLIKRTYENGGTGNSFTQKTIFSQTSGQGTSTSSTTIEQRDVGNNLLAQSKHYFHGNPIPSIIEPFQLPTWNEGREYQTEVFDIVNGSGVLKRRTNQTWQETGIGEKTARLIETQTTLTDTNQISKQTFAYDNLNNVTDTYEYDFGTGAPGAFMRRSHADYITDPNYISHTGSHLRGLPTQSWVSSDINGNNKVSLSQIEYDNYASDARHAPLVSRSNVVGHETTNFGTSYTRRGNPTQTVSYSNASNQTGAVVSSVQYDILGSPIKSIDANGNASTVSYNDNFGGANGEARTNSAPAQLNGQQTFAFPTSATNPNGWTTYAQFDYFTGAGVDGEDIHGNVSSMFYNDLLDRPTQTISANNTAQRAQTTIDYDDANRRIQQTSDLFAFGDNLAKSESFYDGLGRTFENRNYKDGTYVITKQEFDAVGRVKRTTNPYKPSESVLWTTMNYDALSRQISVTTPDGATVTTAYSGNATTATDQAGKQRRSITNGLGQLVRVDEPNDAGQLGTVAAPVQPTAYTYDTLNNLVQVNQGAQQRNFTYNSLSRLLSATNPESGTINYQYDANGNLTQKTDARGVVTNYVYDNINRVTNRNYSDGTPNVTYAYDNSSIPFSKGRLTQVQNATNLGIVSTTNYTNFDNLGRVLNSQQITDGQTYNFGYSYNLSGALVNETYPSGRIVTNNFENDGDLAQVNGSYQSSAKTYVGNFSYTSAGAVSATQLGNGRWENTVFNSRLQPVQIGLGSSANTQDLWKVNYEFGELQSNGAVDSSKNNGNVAKQTIVVPSSGSNQGFTATQAYFYDSLDRLKQAKETVGTQTVWQQTFLFDRYSNRRFDTTQTSTLNGQLSPQITNPIVNESNNRFKPEDGYSYDLSGNLTHDAYGNRYNYEADGKTSKFFSSSNNTSQPNTVYFYDGQGKRIKKVDGNTTTIFVFDANGKMAAEYSTDVVSSTLTTTYVTQDDYDNPRIMTDDSGQVKQRRDYMPFGEELLAGYGSRTEALGYVVANVVRQGFAGKDKDSETGFNYFGERYYSSSLGRFTSPDTLMASGGAYNPQTWNRYAYVVNNPVAYIDVNGQIRRDKNGKIKEFKPIIPGPAAHPSGVNSFGSYLLIRTDKDRDIVVFKNNPSSALYNYKQDFNCHGLTFTQGQYVIDNSQVDTILEDEYRLLTSGEKPQVGDVVIYYDATAQYKSPNGVVHSATITETDGTEAGTRVSGLGGIQTESRTTTLDTQHRNENGSYNTIWHIFRKKKENKEDPTPQQRAEIARNAVKTPPNREITTEPPVLGTTIIPRELVPLPPRPEPKKPL